MWGATYLALSDKERKVQPLLTVSILAQPADARLMVLGNLNTNLDSARDK